MSDFYYRGPRRKTATENETEAKRVAKAALAKANDEKATPKDELEAGRAFLKIGDKNNKKIAFNLYIRAMNHGSVEAMFEIYKLYNKGIFDDSFFSVAKPYQYFLKALERGYGKAIEYAERNKKLVKQLRIHPTVIQRAKEKRVKIAIETADNQEATAEDKFEATKALSAIGNQEIAVNYYQQAMQHGDKEATSEFFLDIMNGFMEGINYPPFDNGQAIKKLLSETIIMGVSEKLENFIKDERNEDKFRQIGVSQSKAQKAIEEKREQEQNGLDEEAQKRAEEEKEKIENKIKEIGDLNKCLEFLRAKQKEISNKRFRNPKTLNQENNQEKVDNPGIMKKNGNRILFGNKVEQNIQPTKQRQLTQKERDEEFIERHKNEWMTLYLLEKVNETENLLNRKQEKIKI